MFKSGTILKNQYVVSFFFSFLYILSFPPYNIPALGFFSILGLFYVIYRANSIKGLLQVTLLISFFISMMGVYWVIFATKYSFNSYFLGLLVLVGFSLLYSVFIFTISIPLLFLKKLEIKKYYHLVLYMVLVISFSSADALKYYFLGGFPWFISAYIWHFSDEIIQIVSVIGVSGLSVITYCFIFSFVFLFCNNKSLLIRFIIPLFFMICFIFIYFYGSNRIEKINRMSVEKEIPLRIVHTSIPQDSKMSIHDLMLLQESIINQATKGLVDNNSKVVFLPEASFIFFDDKQINNIVKHIPPKSFLVTGAMRLGKEDKVYNSIFALGNSYTDYYDKQKLVPFGERIPLADYIPDIFSSFVALQNISVGSENRFFNINNYQFIINICFESLFPMQHINLSQIDFIFNSSNEAWFNNSVELDQYWSISRYRSIEMGVPFVKSSNRGISGIYDILGNEILSIRSSTSHNIDITLEIKKIQTQFSKINYHFIHYALFFFYILVVLSFIITRLLYNKGTIVK